MCACVFPGLTNKPDDVERGVGENWCVGLIEVVVGLLLGSHGFSGYAGGRVRESRSEP